MTITVLKVGGAVFNEPEAAQQLISAVAQLQQQQRQILLVHGGGALVADQLAACGLTSEKIDGLRVTPDSHMPVVAGVLAGYINKHLVALARSQQLTAVGLSLADGAMTTATAINEQLQAVGHVQPGDPALLTALLAQGWLPIVSSIATTEQGRLVNVNADDAAQCLAELLNAELVLLSDVDGVLDADQQLLPELSAQSIEELCASSVIRDGMAVKVRAALACAQRSQADVVIANWRYPQRLPALLAGEPVGTRICANKL